MSEIKLDLLLVLALVILEEVLPAESRVARGIVAATGIFIVGGMLLGDVNAYLAARWGHWE